MKDKRTEDIIRAYLAGKDSPEGEALFREWYASFHDEPTLEIPEAEKEKLRKSMFQTIEKRKKHYLLSTPIYRAAAIFIGFFLLASVGIWYYLDHQLLEIKTASTELRELILPDGSRITLNANSCVRYASSWSSEDAREIWLEGEGFFSVLSTPDNQKFVVHTPNLDVQVLGTTFNVRYRRQQTAVVLTEGAVEVYAPSSQERMLMEPGDYLRRTVSQSKLSKTKTNPQLHTAWLKQQLILDDTSLKEIAALLEDYYGYKVILSDDQLSRLRLSATNTLALEDPDVLLAAIAEIFSLEITQKQRTVYFEKK